MFSFTPIGIVGYTPFMATPWRMAFDMVLIINFRDVT